jgi:hypothetical protein
MDQECFTLRRQLGAAGATPEEGRAKRLLQSGKASGHRSVIETEGAGRSQNLPMPRYGEEYPDIIPIHVATLSAQWMRE